MAVKEIKNLYRSKIVILDAKCYLLLQLSSIPRAEPYNAYIELSYTNFSENVEENQCFMHNKKTPLGKNNLIYNMVFKI